ncbi:kinesin family member [Acrasis kona]|uniref:Kinesin-like protein n=1 Tax=Acrasis kona TaxID=1008807 RepID=A0AAW2YXN6_9EUKA
MVKSAVKVIVRTRPTANFAQGYLDVKDGIRAININLPKKNETQNVVNNQRESYSFKFDNVLHNSSQETVFEECGREVISSFIDGYNGTIMAYGQTGAGKTFTMTGTTANYKQRGIIPRCIEHIFQEISNKPEKAFNVSVTYLEIYNENLFDLLNNDPTGSDDYQIMEDAKGVTFVRGIQKVATTSEEEALSLMFEGEANRAICEHQMNKASTRSHCVFTIHLESRSRVESNGQIVYSKLNLVDLAGSERVGKTHSSGQVLKEATYINKSLSFLEQVVIALSTPSREHVPYRQSKLTMFLKDSLGGNCKTLLVANIWGEATQLDETVSTLKFASRMMRVSNEATINIHMNPEALIKKYEKQIVELKQELAMHDQLKGVNQATYDPYTEEQQLELRKEIKRYVRNETEELEIKNIRHIKEIFQQFKKMMQTAELEARDRGSQPVTQRESKSKLDNGALKGSEANVSGVGDVDDNNGFGVGAAVPSANYRKESVVSQTRAQEEPEVNMMKIEEAEKAPIDRNEAYELFKSSSGSESIVKMKEETQLLKDKKNAFKVLTLQVNEAKKKIDSTKEEIEAKQQEVSGQKGDNDIVDEEEMLLYQRLKEAKKEYRDSFEERKMAKAEIDFVSRAVENSRVKLLSSFEDWYRETYGQPLELEQSSPDINTKESFSRDKDEDQLDDGERFEKLELERIRRDDPESLAFYRAKKVVGNKTLKKTLSQKR